MSTLNQECIGQFAPIIPHEFQKKKIIVLVGCRTAMCGEWECHSLIYTIALNPFSCIYLLVGGSNGKWLCRLKICSRNILCDLVVVHLCRALSVVCQIVFIFLFTSLNKVLVFHIIYQNVFNILSTISCGPVNNLCCNWW